MLKFLIENLSTIIVLAVVILIVTLIVVKLIKDKKQGKTSCSCGCDNCALNGTCHTKNKQNETK